jgi:hypothetical protein
LRIGLLGYAVWNFHPDVGRMLHPCNDRGGESLRVRALRQAADLALERATT